MTLHDLEWRNGPYFGLRYLSEFGTFWADYVKVVEDYRPIAVCETNIARRMYR